MKKLAYAVEIMSWFSSIPMLQNQARAVKVCATVEERVRMPEIQSPLIKNLIEAMGEAGYSPDPYQRSCWYMYQDHTAHRPVDFLAEKVVLVLPLAWWEMEQQQQLQQQEMPEQH